MSPTFRKSLRLLTHPLSLAAMGLMLVNDLLLKSLAPSWLSGKLSDVAGLFFLPFLAAVIFACLAPARPYHGHADRLVGILAFFSVALGYSLLKLDPAFNTSFFSALHALSGVSLRAAVDPSDLLALPALLAAAWLWFSPQQGASLPSSSLHWATLALPLSALILLADAAAPDYGIACLETQGSLIVARASYGRTFTSSDGGLHWQTASANPNQQECIPKSAGWQTLLSAPDGRQYRITGGKSIERSTDRGVTWQPIYQPAPVTEAEASYIKRTRGANLLLFPGPDAALIDPASANLVVAMGQEGVLVIKADGSMTWVAVDNYRRDELKQGGVGAYGFLLSNEILFALAAALLWWSTAALRLERPTWLLVLTILGWVGSVLVAFAIMPGIGDSSYTAVFAFLGLMIALLWGIGLLVAGGIRHGQRSRLKKFFGLALYLPLVFVLVLLPYILWALNVIPAYWAAALIAAFLWIACAVVIKPRSPAQ